VPSSVVRSASSVVKNPARPATGGRADRGRHQDLAGARRFRCTAGPVSL